MPSRHRQQPSPPTAGGRVEAPDGARDGLAGKVAALRRPQSYPGEVGTVEAIETHMSWVFLTQEYAYKLKKPVRMPLLDYTTLARRRRACATEVDINRALAAEVYLGVVPLAETGGELRVEGDDKPVEWLVKMRRLPRELMLDARIERGEVGAGDIERVAAKLTTFYENTEQAALAGPTHRERIISDVAAKRASLEQPHYGLKGDEIRAAAADMGRWLDNHGDLLEARGALVVDAHGDLRPEHVCLQAEPVIIDRPEFERSLRLLDPVSELAFLGMESRRLGADWIGPKLLEVYTEDTGDEPPDGLVAFYGSYHALIRAAISVWHLDDQALDHSDTYRARAHHYLRLIQRLL